MCLTLLLVSGAAIGYVPVIVRDIVRALSLLNVDIFEKRVDSTRFES